MDNAQTSQDSAVTQPTTTESQPLDPNQGTAGNDITDDWAEAQEAFNDPEGFKEEEELKQPQKPVEQKTEGESKSHLEQDQPEYLKLDDLRVPQKYKSAVQERLQKVASEFEGKIQASNETLGQYQESYGSLVDTFKQIAQNPRVIPDLVAQYGEQLGLDPQLVQHYKSMKQNAGQPQSQPVQKQEGNATPKGIQSVFEKYNQKLVTTQDSNEFLSTLNARDSEMIEMVRNEMSETFKQMLGGYHDENVKPTLQTLEDQKKEGAHKVRSSSWRQAKDLVAGKEEYKADFAKYENAIRERLDKDPRRHVLNENPEVARQLGYDHQTLIEEAYLLVSRADHLRAAKTPKPKFAGLEPNSKHITTQKAGGGDWDDPYHKEVWGLS